jgi:glutamine amidotransferase
MIVIVDYGMGNLGSIINMVRYLGHNAQASADPVVIANANRLILPGVGAFDAGMRQLIDSGLDAVLQDCVSVKHVPLLGICLGLQLLGQGSQEGTLPGLGWLDATACRFDFGDGQEQPIIPHMGWNTIVIERDDPLLSGLPQDARFYFVHSFHMVARRQEQVLASTVHGYPFPSVMRNENIWGVQFHPEKSHRFGMKVLENFLAVD